MSTVKRSDYKELKERA